LLVVPGKRSGEALFRMKFVVLFCCSVAVAAAAAHVYAPQQAGLAIIVAVTMLVCAQVVAMMASAPSGEAEDARLAALARRISKNAADIAKLGLQGRDQAQKVAELENRMLRMPPREVAMIASDDSTVQYLPQSPAAPSAPAAMTPPTPPAPPVLCLEPVVRLSEGRTAYYKASLQYPPASDGDSGHADQDIELLRQVLPVLAKLRARRGAAGIFVPISTATLEDRARLETYVGALRASPAESAGIVLDLHVSALAALSEPALRGLAWLASLGATFCLTGPGAAASDLAALSELGFTFVDVPCHELVAANGQLSTAMGQVMHGLAANKLTLITCGLKSGDEVAGLARFAVLGRGPVFAAPRAIRPQQSQDYPSQQVA
jgi:hypothetical protein